MTANFEPLFLDASAGALGRRFAVHHPPQGGETRGLVVYVHPFAEEMNKARRMAAMQARILARHGWAVLQMDLLGCGDSAGDFGDATWARWVEDVVFAARWLQERHGGDSASDGDASRLCLWGLRAGSLLAVEAAAQIGSACDFLFWQPATSGKAVLQQFLRLKVAGEILGGQARGAAEQLRAEIDAGRPVEVAGYQLHAELCRGLDRAALTPPPGLGRLDWLELQPREHMTLSPIAASTVSSWRAAGWSVRTRVVQGPAFWQTTEIEDAPALLAATQAAVGRPDAAESRAPDSTPGLKRSEGARA